MAGILARGISIVLRKVAQSDVFKSELTRRQVARWAVRASGYGNDALRAKTIARTKGGMTLSQVERKFPAKEWPKVYRDFGDMHTPLFWQKVKTNSNNTDAIFNLYS